MSKIKIDHAQVKSLAKTYDKAHNTIEDIIKELDSTQSSLSEVWEGKAWSQFDSTYKEFKPKVKDFGEFLESVGKQLKENAKVMEDVDQQLEKANQLK